MRTWRRGKGGGGGAESALAAAAREMVDAWDDATVLSDTYPARIRLEAAIPRRPQAGPPAGDPGDPEERLAELAAMRPGWLDGDADPPSPDAVAAVAELGYLFAVLGVPAPRLFPTFDGGVSCEWTLADGAVAGLEVDADGTVHCSVGDPPRRAPGQRPGP